MQKNKKLSKPLLVTSSFLPPLNEYVELLEEIWGSHWLTNQGPIHERFTAALKKYMGVKGVTLFTNGHLALDAALRSLSLSGEVITTPFTFVSTAHAIKMNNLTPVFCDIKLSDYTIDESKIEALITEKTSAILGVHVYGNPCAAKEIERIAKKHKLKVIYDAAHAFGVRVNGETIGNFGDISMFSFHATKVFNSVEGGVLTYSDQSLQAKLDLIKNFGITGPETIEAIGYNAKMSEFHAAMGLLNLNYVDECIAKRKEIFQRYYQKLNDVPGLTLCIPANTTQHNYSYMPVLIEKEEFGINRDQLYNELATYNIFARKYFFPLITKTAPYQSLGGTTPHADYVSNNILCLPMAADMTLEQVDLCCEVIKECIIKG